MQLTTTHHLVAKKLEKIGLIKMAQKLKKIKLFSSQLGVLFTILDLTLTSLRYNKSIEIETSKADNNPLTIIGIST